jgi:alkylation response protein AidB-like acyl-CoA dehydrogenase
MVMRASDSRSEARFRAELGEWLDDNHPAADRASDPPRSPGHIPRWAGEWQRRLFDAGWLVPRWPPELGGRDATAIEQLIYFEEMARRRVPRAANPQGLDVCAPTLVDHGVGPQGDEWVLAILRGEVSWCVAVDDAAAAGTDPPAILEPVTPVRAPGLRLVEAAGGWSLHGSVPAPPGASHADRCLCAAWLEASTRGDDDLAMVAADLGAPGVTRPGGESAALVFDGVAVIEGDIVGERGQAWPVLRSVRSRTRSVRWITSLLAIERALDALADVVRARGLAGDGVFRDRMAGLQVEADGVRALAYRAMAKHEAGHPNPELAMLPLATAETEERVYLAALDALGAEGLDMSLDGPMGWPRGSWASEWAAAGGARARAGGSGAERDRVAARILGVRLR